MLVDTALSVIDRFIAQALEQYNESVESKDQQGNRIPHPLDSVDEDDKLFFLDIALKDVALKTTPVSLIEGNDSSATELKRISKDYYVRVPAYPQKGKELDIDEGLSYAVIFIALASMWEGFGEYEQKGEMICNVYNTSYRSYIADLISGATANPSPNYVRFSADGETWHDSYQEGDVYISFKRGDTGTWTPAIRFVGKDGKPCSDTQLSALQDTPDSYAGAGGKIVAVKQSEDGVEFIDPPSGGGSGATTFTELTDTPNDYAGAKGKKVVVKQTEDGVEFASDTFTSLDDTPADYTGAGGKFVAVKSDASGLEFVDAPSGGGASGHFGDNATYYDGGGGTYTADTENFNSFWIYPTDDLVIDMKTFQDSGQDVQGWFGSTYTFALVSNGAINITFADGVTIYGDATVAKGDESTNTNITMTILELYYDGYAFAVKNRAVINDYNG